MDIQEKINKMLGSQVDTTKALRENGIMSED